MEDGREGSKKKQKKRHEGRKGKKNELQELQTRRNGLKNMNWTVVRHDGWGNGREAAT